MIELCLSLETHNMWQESSSLLKQITRLRLFNLAVEKMEWEYVPICSQTRMCIDYAYNILCIF